MVIVRRELRLMVVDDQDSYSEFLSQFSDLWNEQYRLVLNHVHSAEEAILQLQSVRPNVIMVDAHLPDVNSLDFIEQCVNEKVSLVITSENHSSTLAESALSRGAKAYLPKTEDPEEVEFILEQLAHLSGNGQLEFH